MNEEYLKYFHDLVDFNPVVCDYPDILGDIIDKDHVKTESYKIIQKWVKDQQKEQTKAKFLQKIALDY